MSPLSLPAGTLTEEKHCLEAKFCCAQGYKDRFMCEFFSHSIWITFHFINSTSCLLKFPLSLWVSKYLVQTMLISLTWPKVIHYKGQTQLHPNSS